MQEQQPGQVIAPGASAPRQVMPPVTPEVSAVAQQQPAPVSQSAASVALEPQSTVVEQPAMPEVAESNEYAKYENQAPEEYPTDMVDTITWTTAENLNHQKTSKWYGAYSLGAILLAAVLFFITKDIISTVVVIGAVAGLLFISSREPKQQTYTLREDFVQVGNKPYGLHDFKAFSVDEESPVLGITLLPLKRFMPPVVLYVDEANEEAVVDYIANFLPIEPHKVDAMDSLLRRLHF
ncbi:hypothetical protein IPP75_04230 [Candidatus Saccharibacteria bacterium]|nr:MAG: hypothetical protein IPP75_04230 [Candidatus Saccharibacteria bacterium]